MTEKEYLNVDARLDSSKIGTSLLPLLKLKQIFVNYVNIIAQSVKSRFLGAQDALKTGSIHLTAPALLEHIILITKAAAISVIFLAKVVLEMQRIVKPA